MKTIKVDRLPNKNFLVFVDGVDFELSKSEAEMLSMELGYAVQDADIEDRGEGEAFKV